MLFFESILKFKKGKSCSEESIFSVSLITSILAKSSVLVEIVELGGKYSCLVEMENSDQTLITEIIPKINAMSKKGIGKNFIYDSIR